MVGLCLVYVLNSRRKVAFIKRASENGTHAGLIAIVGIRPIGVQDFYLSAIEVPTGNDVDHPCHGVCTVGRGAAILEDLNTLNHRRRNGLIVPSVDRSPAINEIKRPARADTTKIDSY